MKKFVILLVLIAFQMQMTVCAANYVKKPAQKPAEKTTNVSNKTTSQVYKQDDNNYLLKYNIDDLEAAPWLNNGERVYKTETK